MIHHVVLVWFEPGASAEAIEELSAALRRLPTTIPEIRSYACGVDLALRDGTADFAITATFDDEAGWRAYVEHPDHTAVVHDHLAALASRRASAQFEIPD